MFRQKLIKYTKQASATILSTNATATYTIPQAVVLANTLIFHNGWNANNGGAFNIDDFMVNLTGTTTVTVDRSEDVQAYAMTCLFTIVEFYPGILRNVQRGVINILSGNSSANVTLTRNTNYNYALNSLGSVDDFNDKLSIALAGTTLTASDARGSIAAVDSNITYQYYEM